MLAVRQGSLGHIRYVLKSDLKWIPLYGFYFQEVKINENIFFSKNEIINSMVVFMFIVMIKKI